MKKIISLLLVLVFCPISTVSANNNEMTPSGIPYSELQDHIDEYVADYVGISTAGANIAIVKDGAIFINSSYGYASIDKQLKVTSNTVFEWGSVTKLLVWTSVMQLVEQGTLDLNEDIRTYLPDGFLTNTQYDTPITILNLMHHDAGWEDRYIDMFYTSANDLKPLEQMLHIVKPNQIHKPGDIVAYSNYGVALAAFIVEQLTNQPFYEYVNDHIFAVLNMHDTSLHPSQKDQPHVASRRDDISGYEGSDGQLRVSPYERSFIGLYPSGSAIGTIEDVAKFMIALLPSNSESSPLFQNEQTLEKMLSTSKFFDNGLPRNAHGFWKSLYGIELIGHAGNTESFSSNFLFSKEHNLGVIIMTNQKNEVSLTYGLPTLLFGQYVSPSTNEELLHVSKHEENYYWARRQYKGFGKLYGVLTSTPIEVIDQHTVKAFNTPYKQIDTSLYQSTDGSNDLLHVTVNDDRFVKVSTLTSDMIPFSTSSKIFIWLSLLAAAFSIVYTVIMLMLSTIQYIRKRKKFRLSKIETWLLLANFIPLINIAFLFYRVLNYTPYAAIKIHFWINYAYILIVALCIIAIVFEWRNKPQENSGKIRYVLSCCSALLLIILIFGWELYY